MVWCLNLIKSFDVEFLVCVKVEVNDVVVVVGMNRLKLLFNEVLFDFVVFAVIKL